MSQLAHKEPLQCHQLKFVEPARTPEKHAHHYYIFRNNIDKIAELFLNRIQIKYTLLKYRYGNGRKKKRGEKEGNLMFFPRPWTSQIH